MSKIDRHSAVTPSPKEQSILMRALGCGVEELVARLGQENAIRRVETELRRAKRARSRKLHTFWSAVLVTIDTDTDERRNTKPKEARGTCPRRVMTRGTCGGLSDPGLLSRQPTNILPRGVSLLLDHDLGQVSAPTPFS
jgi:hypothetical protein